MPDFSRIYNYFYAGKDLLAGLARSLWDFWGFRILAAGQLAVNVLSWSLAAYIVRNAGQPQIALHYSVDFGIDLFDDAGKAFVIPFLGLVFIIFNWLILAVMEKFNPRETVFAIYLLGGAGLFANLILLAALASIYIINFR